MRFQGESVFGMCESELNMLLLHGPTYLCSTSLRHHHHHHHHHIQLEQVTTGRLQTPKSVKEAEPEVKIVFISR